MSDKGVCRTAPATPGLLKRHSVVEKSDIFILSSKISSLNEDLASEHQVVYEAVEGVGLHNPSSGRCVHTVPLAIVVTIGQSVAIVASAHEHCHKVPLTPG